MGEILAEAWLWMATAFVLGVMVGRWVLPRK